MNVQFIIITWKRNLYCNLFQITPYVGRPDNNVTFDFLKQITLLKLIVRRRSKAEVVFELSNLPTFLCGFLTEMKSTVRIQNPVGSIWVLRD